MADTSLIFNVIARDRASSVMLRIGGAAKAALAAAAYAAARITVDSIKSASDLAETQSKVGVLFGSASQQIIAMSGTAAKSMGQSKQSFLDAASTFAVFGKGAGLAGQDLVKFSTGLTGLASDMASFSNTSPEEAIEAIGAALRGESDPIEKYGVLLNADTLAARAMSMGLVKARVDMVAVRGAQIALADAQAKYNKISKDGNASAMDKAKATQAVSAAQARLKKAMGGTTPQLTAQQKVLAAQAEIMAQTKAAQGDFSRTSSGLANQQRILTAEWANAKTTLGTQLLPVVLALVHGLSSTVDWVSANHRWLIPLVAALGAFAGVIYLIITAQKIWTAVQTAFNIVMALNPVVLIVLGILLLIAVIVLIATKTRWFQAIWGAVWGFIKGVGLAIGHWFAGPFAGFFVSLWNFLKALFLGYWNFWKGVWTWIIQKAVSAASAIRNAITGAANWVVSKMRAAANFVASIPGRIRSAFSSLAGIITGPFWSAFNGIKSAWNSTIGGRGFSLPSWIPGIGGRSFHIPYLDVGGLITSTGLAVVHRGETVTPASAAPYPGGGGPMVLEIRSDGTKIADAFVEILQLAVRKRGGLDVVFGGR